MCIRDRLHTGPCVIPLTAVARCTQPLRAKSSVRSCKRTVLSGQWQFYDSEDPDVKLLERIGLRGGEGSLAEGQRKESLTFLKPVYKDYSLDAEAIGSLNGKHESKITKQIEDNSVANELKAHTARIATNIKPKPIQEKTTRIQPASNQQSKREAPKHKRLATICYERNSKLPKDKEIYTIHEIQSPKAPEEPRKGKMSVTGKVIRASAREKSKA
eukprot:TRINITY_DN14814_c0_g2_i2.p1 TRINITY_DN14814_c0_g2~~TRINITY_DN14814_c0_g2_i2.p1  ORF type:complete len:215 (+),score=29.25 TRINITY_DN14814_c0_g2_i2:73-717(+)